MRALSVCLFILFLGPPALADPVDATDRTLRFDLESAVLGERREFVVRLPEDYYRDADARYPVVYVTDADWNFPLVAATIDFHVENGRLPPHIVVGALNVSRNRDFVPRASPSFPGSGGGDRYLDHVAQEWIAFMDSEFRTSDVRLVFGHSFGGTFVLNQLLTDPDLFDAHIALGSSTWVSDRVLFERAEAFFDAGRAMETVLYMSVGEADGGATVPDGNRFAELIEDRAPATLDWRYDVTPREDHFTNAPVGLHRALAFIYPAWGLAGEVEAAAREGGADAVEAWFAETEDALGWRFRPEWYSFGLAGIELARDGEIAAARALFERLETAHPGMADVYFFRALGMRDGGALDDALASVRRAIAVGEAEGLDPMRLESYRALEASVREDMEDGA